MITRGDQKWKRSSYLCYSSFLESNFEVMSFFVRMRTVPGRHEIFQITTFSQFSTLRCQVPMDSWNRGSLVLRAGG